MVGASGTEGATVTELLSADGPLKPTALMALTLKRYLVPLSRPVIVCVVAVSLNVIGDCGTPSMTGVTSYPVIGEPPLNPAVHETVASLTPAVASPIVGASGTAIGVTELEIVDIGPVPTAFFAATLNRYVVPLVKPVTICVVAVELNVVDPTGPNPTYRVTVYAVIGDPPSEAGAVHDTVA